MEISRVNFIHFQSEPGAAEKTAATILGPRLIMDDSNYRLNFDLGRKNKIHHHS
jgi:hypothetical protein